MYLIMENKYSLRTKAINELPVVKVTNVSVLRLMNTMAIYVVAFSLHREYLYLKLYLISLYLYF